MTTDTFTEEIFPPVIDNTMRVSFTSCHRKFYFQHIRGLVPLSHSIHLHAGKAFAKGIEITRKSFYSDHMAADDAERAGAAALKESYGDFDVLYGFEDHAKSLSNMLRGFFDYFLEYPLTSDPITPYMGDGKAAVEFSFTVPLSGQHPSSGDPLLYGGSFDMLGIRDRGLFVVDEKTTTSLGESWRKQWDLNSQFTGYCYGAQQYGYPVAGAIIRGVGLLKTKVSHEQALVYRPKHLIDRWREQLDLDVSRMIECWKLGRWDYAFNNACTDYGGCPFKMLCLSQNAEEWIPVNFRVERWDPMAAKV